MGGTDLQMLDIKCFGCLKTRYGAVGEKEQEN